MDTHEYSQWFRSSTPYISAHRGKTFVVYLGGDAMEHNNLINIVHDLALLHVLGVHLVLVHGGRPQLDNLLGERVHASGYRVTNSNDMAAVTATYGLLRTRLEALFSTGLPNTPLHQVEVGVVSGNFVAARPLGVVDGVDYQLTGSIRSLKVNRVQASLDAGNIVLLSPLGFSRSGQAFNLVSEELASAVSVMLKADKLIMLDELTALRTASGARASTLTPTSLQQLLEQDLQGAGEASELRLRVMTQAVRGGVTKAHILSYAADGGLLQELFTADGIGTQIVEEQTNPVRQARQEDVSGIVEIIRPLEESGVLVRRSRDRLEQEIEQFLVAEVDAVVAGCCAVYPFGDSAELACIAVHGRYRRDSGLAIGANLLNSAEHNARNKGAKMLFALTTQTQEWFSERGFNEADVSVLPESKQSLYNWQRGSKVMTKNL